MKVHVRFRSFTPIPWEGIDIFYLSILQSDVHSAIRLYLYPVSFLPQRNPLCNSLDHGQPYFQHGPCRNFVSSERNDFETILFWLGGSSVTKDEEIRQVLTTIPGWKQLPQEFFDFCLTRSRWRHYAAKQYLYFSGDDPTSLFILLNGRIQLILTGEFNEKILRVLRPPTLFPEVALDGKPYPHAALALEATDVLSLDREALRQYLGAHPALLWPFMQALATDLRRSYRQIKNLSLGDARLRLGAKLFALAHAHGIPAKNGFLIGIPLSATELAGMCSLARESVSRILGELRQADLIDMEKKNITVRNVEGLRRWIHERESLKGSL